MSTETDGRDGDDAEDTGYVHRPDGEPAVDADESASEEGFGRRGWVLVVAVVLSTLVIPGVIYVAPGLVGRRVPFLVAMLVLPFVPAVLLGVVAVWSMTER